MGQTFRNTQGSTVTLRTTARLTLPMPHRESTPMRRITMSSGGLSRLQSVRKAHPTLSAYSAQRAGGFILGELRKNRDGFTSRETLTMRHVTGWDHRMPTDRRTARE